MLRLQPLLRTATAAFVLLTALPAPSSAQDAAVTIAASGLTNPRGFTWNADGSLIVAQAGSGGETPASGEVEVPPPNGPYTGGQTASVVEVANGCVLPIAESLPSSRSATGEVVGVADVAYLKGQLYALIAGGGAAHGNPDQPNGIYAIGDDGKVNFLVDLGAWINENPVERPPEIDFDPEGSFFSMSASPQGDRLYVVESNSEQVLSVTSEGQVTRVADLSRDNQVPTAIALAPDGGLYVAELTSAPFPNGAARVLEISPDGAVSTAWSGLTAVTGIAVDAEGTLYAAQLSTTRARPPFLQPATGSIVRRTGEETSEPVATGLNFPVSLDFGPDGALYVALPAIGADDGGGSILRIQPGDAPLQIDLSTLTEPSCSDGTGLGSTSSDNESNTITGDGTGSSEPPPTALASSSEVIVRVFDFGFDNAVLTVPVGTTVIWANTGAVQHTTVSIRDATTIWDSGVLDPGGTFAFTFTEPGTWDYACAFHSEMTGQIVVE